MKLKLKRNKLFEENEQQTGNGTQQPTGQVQQGANAENNGEVQQGQANAQGQSGAENAAATNQNQGQSQQTAIQMFSQAVANGILAALPETAQKNAPDNQAIQDFAKFVCQDNNKQSFINTFTQYFSGIYDKNGFAQKEQQASAQQQQQPAQQQSTEQPAQQQPEQQPAQQQQQPAQQQSAEQPAQQPQQPQQQPVQNSSTTTESIKLTFSKFFQDL